MPASPVLASPQTAPGRLRLTLAVAGSVFFWASAYPAIRVALRLFSPGQLASVRFLLASACFGGVVAVKRPRLPAGDAVWRVLLAGVLGIGAYNLLLNTGEEQISAGAASFLINCMPVFAALLGVLLGERLPVAGWLGVATSFAGVALIALGTPGGMHAGLASLLVLGAAAAAAVMSFLQKPLLRSYSPIAVTACMMWTGGVLLAPFLPGAARAIAHADPGTVVLPLWTAIYLGIVPAALGYLTWAEVLRLLPLAKAASVLYFIPPVTLLVSFVWLGERPGAGSLTGGVLAIAGVLLLSHSGPLRRS